MKYINILISFLFLGSNFNAIALDSQMRLISAKPTTTQNLEISELEISYLHQAKQFTDDFELSWYPVINISSLSVAEESALTLGGALGISYPITSTVNVFTEGGMRWLSKFEFGQRGRAFKDYGGQWQYQTKMGLSYQLQDKFEFGYAYLHMSNGHRYRINPALDSHALYLTYQF